MINKIYVLYLYCVIIQSDSEQPLSKDMFL